MADDLSKVDHLPSNAQQPSWDDLRAFLAVAEQGSMNKAGLVLHESQPTIGRRMRRLERTVGVALLVRGPNAASLTSAGRDLLDALAPMSAAARRIGTAILPHRASSDAPLKVTTTNTMSLFLARHLPSLRQVISPRDVLLLPTRRVLDLTSGEADIALRLRRMPAGGDMLVRKVCRIGFAFYGVSDDPTLAVIMPANRSSVAGLYEVAIRLAKLRPTGPEIDEMHLRLNAVKAGVGIGALPCWIGDAEPGLMRVHDSSEHRIVDDVFLIRAAHTAGNRDVETLAHAIADLLETHRRTLLG
jgi:DNA-binding transcriptional LysR family regulator